MVVDIGTGDGRYVFRSARKEPDKFFIGIDANPKPLRKMSTKAERTLSKGRPANAMFIQAAVEDLPEELTGVADEVHIHFPWGSLLRAVLSGDVSVLSGVRRICSRGAILEVIAGVDSERDRTEIERLGLSFPDDGKLISPLVSAYEDAGLRCLEIRLLAPEEWGSLETSWTRRLKQSPGRNVFLLVFEAI